MVIVSLDNDQYEVLVRRKVINQDRPGESIDFDHNMPSEINCPGSDFVSSMLVVGSVVWVLVLLDNRELLKERARESVLPKQCSYGAVTEPGRGRCIQSSGDCFLSE